VFVNAVWWILPFFGCHPKCSLHVQHENFIILVLEFEDKIIRVALPILLNKSAKIMSSILLFC